MTSALLGFSGFVGSNLLDAHGFDDLYNSQNIGDLAGREYDLVVASANRADSFRINTHGQDDRDEIDALVDLISTARIKKLVLISTVCVYPAGGSPTESTPLSESGLTPYGANRLHQERRLQSSFDTTVVRLPQLYGARLRKGVVYDLANDYRVEYIHPDTRYQHYDVRQLWSTIAVAVERNLSAINIATPPLPNADLAAEVFGIDIRGRMPIEPESPFAQMYTRNMMTEHADVVGGSDGYVCDRTAEVDQLRRFARELRTTAKRDS